MLLVSGELVRGWAPSLQQAGKVLLVEAVG